MEFLRAPSAHPDVSIHGRCVPLHYIFLGHAEVCTAWGLHTGRRTRRLEAAADALLAILLAEASQEPAVAVEAFQTM
jgi:hypothetical protein